MLNLEERVKKIFEKLFGVEISEDFSKDSTDKWDSFMHLDLIVAIEEEFNISFTPNEIGKIFSFSDVVDILKSKGLK